MIPVVPRQLHRSEATSRTTGIETRSRIDCPRSRRPGSEATSRTTGIETTQAGCRARHGNGPVRKLHPGQQGLKRRCGHRCGRCTRAGVRKLHPGQQGLKPLLACHDPSVTERTGSEATSRTTGIETPRSVGGTASWVPSWFGSYIQDNRD